MWDFPKNLGVGKKEDSVKKRGDAWFFYCFKYYGLEIFLLNKILDTVLRIGAGTAILNLAQVPKSKS